MRVCTRRCRERHRDVERKQGLRQVVGQLRPATGQLAHPDGEIATVVPAGTPGALTARASIERETSVVASVVSRNVTFWKSAPLMPPVATGATAVHLDQADGYSWPYVWSCAVGSVLYALAGLATVRSLGRAGLDVDLVAFERSAVTRSSRYVRKLIRVGHPLASSGVRLMTQLARQFEDHPEVRYGLTAMCVGLGQGGTVLWENPHFESAKG